MLLVFAAFYPFSTLLYHGISQQYNRLHRRPLAVLCVFPILYTCIEAKIHITKHPARAQAPWARLRSHKRQPDVVNYRGRDPEMQHHTPQTRRGQNTGGWGDDPDHQIQKVLLLGHVVRASPSHQLETFRLPRMDTTKNRHANSATRSGASGTQRKASGGPTRHPTRERCPIYGGAEGTGGNDGSRVCASPRLKRPSIAKIALRRIMDDEGLDGSYAVQHARRKRNL